jgi:UDP-N-acetylmuramate--alanine ligase
MDRAPSTGRRENGDRSGDFRFLENFPMKQLSPAEVDELLARATPGGTVFLIGAGGCGMSGLGHLLLDLGFKVSGSDLVLNEEVRLLRLRGARVEVGHQPARLIFEKPILVVYSSAIRLENPEVEAAEGARLPIVRRAVLLSALLRRQRGVCVSGMHGKTTTTALLTYALEQLGAKPSYAVGALVPQMDRHARFTLPEPGKPAPYFVVEADESDGTLREFFPEHAIVLNVDEEHLDYYANLDAICRAFKEFAGQTRGKLVFCADDERLAEIFAGRNGAVSFGFHPLAEYRVENVQFATVLGRPLSTFSVMHRGSRLGTFTVELLGEKNVSNAAAVIALLHAEGFPADKIASAISSFRGAARRQQELYFGGGIRIFEDYGHHPREIQATLKALKSLGPRRLLVVFQPHRFTRTQQLLKQFAGAFEDANVLWITDIYAASEDEIPGINGAALVQAVRAHGEAADFVSSWDDLNKTLERTMQAGDILVFLGAGDITYAAHSFADSVKLRSKTRAASLHANLATLLAAETTVRRDEPLAKRTTMRVGGVADVFVEPSSEEDLSKLLAFCRAEQLPFFILGRGSNLLIRDGGIRGVVISLTHPVFSRVEISGPFLHCGAGAKLKAVAVEARRRQLTGVEFLEGIPGSVGGALRMNAGAMGRWMFEAVESIRFMDFSGRIREQKGSEVDVEYRGCPLFKTHIALSAVLRCAPAAKETIDERMRDFSQKRWDSQPAAPSAGCIFKNPAAVPAGKLIDELGLKGTRVGGAAVSDVHGNFIVNDGNATAEDVLNLIEMIKQRARAARGIELQTEVEIVGEN